MICINLIYRYKNIKRGILMSAKWKRALGLAVACGMSTCIVAMAETYYDYSKSIDVENEVYTAVKVKEVSGKAYVDQQYNKTATVKCTMVNSAHTAKSDVYALTGVNTINPSYSGYTVTVGDYIGLKLKNPSSNGSGITVKGSWRP